MKKNTLYLLGALTLIGPGTLMKGGEMAQSCPDVLPKLHGTNLLGESLTFPKDLTAPLTLVVMGFKREQQKDIDTWIHAYKEKNFSGHGIDFFELPIIYEVGPLKRFFINNGMKSGIPDLAQLKRTVTIYMKRGPLFDALQMSEDTISSFLVDKTGKILWRQDGRASPEKIDSLKKVIQNHAAA